jgi:DNA primase small subunit
MLALGGGIRSREFSFLGDVGRPPHRHVSFDKEEEFVLYVARRKMLSRLDVGAVFAIPPSYERFADARQQRVIKRDLRFDIDIGDYDYLENGDLQCRGRSCCSGRQYCRSCWPLATIGCEVLRLLLRDELGAKEVAFFFSGGRGMHCWVMDRDFPLTSPDPDVRKAILERVTPEDPLSLFCHCEPEAWPVDVIEFLLLPTPKEPRGLFLGWFAERHPAVAFYVLEKRLLAREAEEKARAVQWIAPHVRVAQELMDEMRAKDSRRDVTLRDVAAAKEIGVMLDDVAKEFQEGWSPSPSPSMMAIVDAAAWCLMPRTDRKVSTEATHLLKAPLSIHKDTKKLAVRVDESELLEFYPTAAPTLMEDGHFDRPDIAEIAMKDFDEWTKNISKV